METARGHVARRKLGVTTKHKERRGQRIIPSRKANREYPVKKATAKLDAEERQLIESVERGEWKSPTGKRERAHYSRAAKATFREDRRLNIRLSSKDLEAIQSERFRRTYRTRR